MEENFLDMNRGKNILENQNNSYHIDELLAQQNLYSKAKKLQFIVFIIAIPVPILLAIVIKEFPKLEIDKSTLFVLFALLGAFTEKVLEAFINRYKKLAASIQEKFDTSVLDIETNETLNTAQADEEIVRRYSKKLKNKEDKVKNVKNWYSLKINEVNTNISTLLCQRTNIYYDFSVRRRYNRILIGTTIITFLILLLISLQNEFDLRAFLIEALIPIIPLFMYVYNNINNNNESIDNLVHLKKIIEEQIKNIKLTDELDPSLIRSIQDRIYTNRILSPLIPNFLFKRMRPNLEDEMNYSVEQKIIQLKLKST